MASGLAGGPFTDSPKIFLAHQLRRGFAELVAHQHFALAPRFFQQRHVGPRRTGTVTVGLNSAASNLPAGIYTANYCFTNLTSHVPQSRQFTLQSGQCWSKMAVLKPAIFPSGP